MDTICLTSEKKKEGIPAMNTKGLETGVSSHCCCTERPLSEFLLLTSFFLRHLST